LFPAHTLLRAEFGQHDAYARVVVGTFFRGDSGADVVVEILVHYGYDPVGDDRAGDAR
ncbi:hypothetical protein LSAT2_004426, partial [Lamellibrachia satsuma]